MVGDGSRSRTSSRRLRAASPTAQSRLDFATPEACVLGRGGHDAHLALVYPPGNASSVVWHSDDAVLEPVTNSAVSKNRLGRVRIQLLLFCCGAWAASFPTLDGQQLS